MLAQVRVVTVRIQGGSGGTISRFFFLCNELVDILSPLQIEKVDFANKLRLPDEGRLFEDTGSRHEGYHRRHVGVHANIKDSFPRRGGQT